MKCFLEKLREEMKKITFTGFTRYTSMLEVFSVSLFSRCLRFTFYHVLMVSFIIQPIAPNISYAEDVEDRFKETCTAITADLDDPDVSDSKICRDLRKMISAQKRAGNATPSKPIRLPAACSVSEYGGLEGDATIGPNGSPHRVSHSPGGGGDEDGDEDFNVNGEVREKMLDQYYTLKDAKRRALRDPGLIKLWKDHCDAAYDDLEAADKQGTLIYIWAGVAAVCGGACAAALAGGAGIASVLGPACTGAAVIGGITDAAMTGDYLGAVLGLASGAAGLYASGALGGAPAQQPAAATVAAPAVRQAATAGSGNLAATAGSGSAATGASGSSAATAGALMTSGGGGGAAETGAARVARQRQSYSVTSNNSTPRSQTGPTTFWNPNVSEAKTRLEILRGQQDYQRQEIAASEGIIRRNNERINEIHKSANGNVEVDNMGTPTKALDENQKAEVKELRTQNDAQNNWITERKQDLETGEIHGKELTDGIKKTEGDPKQTSAPPTTEAQKPTAAQTVQYCMTTLVAAAQAYNKYKAKSADEKAAEKELDIIDELKSQGQKDAIRLATIQNLQDENEELQDELDDARSIASNPTPRVRPTATPIPQISPLPTAAPTQTPVPTANPVFQENIRARRAADTIPDLTPAEILSPGSLLDIDNRITQLNFKVGELMKITPPPSQELAKIRNDIATLTTVRDRLAATPLPTTAPTATPSPSPTLSPTPTPTLTPTPTPSPSTSPSPSPTPSPSPSPSPSASPSAFLIPGPGNTPGQNPKLRMSQYLAQGPAQYLDPMSHQFSEPRRYYTYSIRKITLSAIAGIASVFSFANALAQDPVSAVAHSPGAAVSAATAGRYSITTTAACKQARQSKDHANLVACAMDLDSAFYPMIQSPGFEKAIHMATGLSTKEMMQKINKGELNKVIASSFSRLGLEKTTRVEAFLNHFNEELTKRPSILAPPGGGQLASLPSLSRDGSEQGVQGSQRPQGSQGPAQSDPAALSAVAGPKLGVVGSFLNSLKKMTGMSQNQPQGQDPNSGENMREPSSGNATGLAQSVGANPYEITQNNASAEDRSVSLFSRVSDRYSSFAKKISPERK